MTVIKEEYIARQFGFGHKWQGDKGEVIRYIIKSEFLKNNGAGDSSTREVLQYIPAGYDKNSPPIPLLVCLAAFGKSALAYANWQGEKENLIERLDRLIGSKTMPPVSVILPDCYTRYGGNQHINSAAIGNYADFIMKEAVPIAEGKIGVSSGGLRGVFGHSSGGYGAMMMGLEHSKFWDGIICHSGDMSFDLGYLPDWPKCLTTLSKFENIEDFINRFENKLKPSWPEKHLMMLLAMAATYDPSPDKYLGIQLPLDPNTAEIIPERWQNWLKNDPVTLAKTHARNLKNLKAIWIDVGKNDEYHLQYGARRLIKTLKTNNIPHHYEEFKAGHSSIDYRLDLSLPFLAKGLIEKG